MIRAYTAPSRAAELTYAVFAVVAPTVVSIFAFASTFSNGFELRDGIILIFMVVITGIGISTGYHRYFAHRSFAAKRPLAICLAVLGTSAGQGYFFRWIADHRVHHLRADAPGDPHSPRFYGCRHLSTIEGLLHAHLLWMFRSRGAIEVHRIKDLTSDATLVAIDRFGPLIVVAGLLMPGLGMALIAGPTHGSFIEGVVWGGFVRMFVLNNIVWGVNSFGHMFGTQPTKLDSSARNNWVLGLLAFGDGWHANHHADPRSARHGRGILQIDVSWIFIMMLNKIGLVTKVEAPNPRKLK